MTRILHLSPHQRHATCPVLRGTLQRTLATILLRPQQHTLAAILLGPQQHTPSHRGLKIAEQEGDPTFPWPSSLRCEQVTHTIASRSSSIGHVLRHIHHCASFHTNKHVTIHRLITRSSQSVAEAAQFFLDVPRGKLQHDGQPTSPSVLFSWSFYSFISNFFNHLGSLPAATDRRNSSTSSSISLSSASSLESTFFFITQLTFKRQDCQPSFLPTVSSKCPAFCQIKSLHKSRGRELESQGMGEAEGEGEV